MPEGPEIRRAADKLEAAIKGEPLTDAWFAFPQLQPYQSLLIGQRVTHIATRGKALLTHFSGGLTLYSHNQLYGVWRVVDAGVEPQSNRVLRVRLQTASKAILLYSASDIDILTAEQVAHHPFLLRVGPDVLDMTLTVEEVKARLLSAKFRHRQFSGLLLDQAFLAGLGNYLRVEILWQAEDYIAAVETPEGLATVFHPELTNNLAFHSYFARKCGLDIDTRPASPSEEDSSWTITSWTRHMRIAPG